VSTLASDRNGRKKRIVGRMKKFFRPVRERINKSTEGFMNRVYGFLVFFIDQYVKIRNRISEGWAERNSSRISEWKLMAYAYSRSLIGILGGILVAIFVFIGIFGPFIAYAYFHQSVNDTPAVINPDLYYAEPCFPPSCNPWTEAKPIFGTDWVGRDLLALMLYGARVSLIISIVVVALGVPLGIILGLVAGYFGGLVDEIIMRITDVFIAFPALILTIALATVLPQRIMDMLYAMPEQIVVPLLNLFSLTYQEVSQLARLLSVVFALVIVWWPGYARMVRGLVLSVREQAFIEAARSLGISTWKILTKHILPNVLSPVIVMVTFDLGTVAILSAALSFLGVGPQDPVPELGYLVSRGRTYFPEKWWLVFIPGSLLFMIAFGWNLLGDSLRDVLDPKTRRGLEFRFKKKEAKEGEESA
jgi:peptide/nickel transport system permease protein